MSTNLIRFPNRFSGLLVSAANEITVSGCRQVVDNTMKE